LKNKYVIEGKVAKVFMNGWKNPKLIAIMDAEDLDKIIPFTGKLFGKFDTHTKDYYVYMHVPQGKINGVIKYKNIRLHRIVLDFWDTSKDIDHRNNNGLDNRKENLRIVTSKNNNRNREKRNSNNKTGYRNVCESGGYLHVQWQVDGKSKSKLFHLDQLEEAGKFAEEMRKKYYGEFAGGN
jgi:hypothetical protein